MFEINQPDDLTILDVPTDILCSYHYFKNIDMARIHSWGTRIIGDSGAFSAMSLGSPITLNDFHEWAHRWKDALFWTASLDMIGDAEGTYRNWIDSKKDGLDLVPTVHYGEDTAQLDRFAEEGATLIGLGGMVPYSSEKDRLMRWCLKMHRHARDHHPQVRFHGWGISHPYLMDNLPWWSADSSGFSSCFRFGTLRLWLPKRGKFTSVDLNGRDLARYAKPLRDHYTVDWKLIAESTKESRRALGRVAIRAVQLYGEWLRTRQIVEVPKLLEPKIGLEVYGPSSVAAMVPSAQGQSITPDGKPIGAQGPRPTVAHGSGSSSPGSLLSPHSYGDNSGYGPKTIAAFGGDSRVSPLDPERV